MQKYFTIFYLDCRAALAKTGVGGWIAALRSQRREWGVDCFAALAKTKLRHCVSARSEAMWQSKTAALDCFAALAKTRVGVN